MKKWISVLMICVLLLGMGGAHAEEEEEAARMAVNLQAIKAALDRNDLMYTYLEESEAFYLEFTLDCSMESCTIWLFAYDDGVLLQADYDLKPARERLDELAKYLMYCNDQGRMGDYYIDYTEEFTGWEMFIYTDVNAPTQHALDFTIALSLAMLESSGDRIHQVLLNGMTAEEAIRADQAAEAD